jgi:hypothetical protein
LRINGQRHKGETDASPAAPPIQFYRTRTGFVPSASRDEGRADANAGGVNPLDPVIRLGGERFSDLNLGGRS